MKISVIGSGSWATAIVKILAFNHHDVKWWVRRQEMVDFINIYHHNPQYLSAVPITLKPEKVNTDLKETIEGSDIIIFSIPSSYFKAVVQKLHAKHLSGKIIVSAIKGMVTGENILISEYIGKHLGIPAENIVAITGPCHAEEVAQEKQSYLTFASTTLETAQITADVFKCRFIKTTITDDICGTEYAAIIKNVCAITSGISHGLGYGDNFQAVLMSNAIKEIRAFLDASYPMKRDILNSAYLGDLLVTGYSQFSRNRTFGNMIGKGYSVKSAQLEMNMVAEGYYAVKTLHEVNRHYKVDMPILNAMYNILYDNIAPIIELHLLAERFR